MQDPVEPEPASPDPADPAPVDDRAPWRGVDRELRSLHAAVAELRREVRMLRTQRTDR